MERLGEVVRFGSLVVREVHHREVKYPAAALAYYTFIATLPLMLLVLVLLGEQLAKQIALVTPAFLTPEARRLVGEALTTAEGRTGASILAIVVFVWAAVNVAAGYQTALARIDPASGQRSPFRRARDGVIVIGAISVGVIVIGIASTLPSLLPGVPYSSVFAAVVLLPALILVFLPLYVVPSGTAQSVRSALPGAVVAAVGWTLLQMALQIYAQNAGVYALYGVLSGVILLLTSLYLGAHALIIGALVNALLSSDGRRG